MAISALLMEQVFIFIPVLTRVSGMVLSAPIFGSQNVPNQIKVAVSMVLALIFVPLFTGQEITDYHPMSMLIVLLTELLIGIAIGLIANLFFSAVHIAGQLMDMQMGFIIANVMDPQFQSQVPLIGQFQYILAILVFLSINGHHLLIRTVYQSYEFVPLGVLTNLGAGGLALNQLFSRVFLLSLQVGAPAVGTLFLTNIALGVLARTVPQMNVFMIGFPVKIFVGFIALILMMPLYNLMLSNLFEHIWDGIFIVLDSM